MGDVAMTIPVLIAFRRSYPDVRITFLTRPFFASLMRPLGIRVLEADVKGVHKGITGLWKLSSTLRAGGFDAVADLHNVLRTKILRGFFCLTPIPFFQLDKGRREKKALVRPERKIFKPLKSTVKRYAEVFERLGFPLELQGEDILAPLAIPAEVTTYLEEKEGPWVGVAPFAAHKGKQYPLEQMKSVVQALVESGQQKILLFGAPGREAEQLKQWEQEFPEVYSLAGNFNFDQEIATLSNLDVMLAMDSGNAHIAAAFGVPTVTLWGVTHPYAGFAPYHQPEANALLADREAFPAIPTSVFGNRYPDGYERAMETIPPARVISRILTVLDQAKVRADKERR